MKLSIVVVLATLPLSTLSFNPFRQTIQADALPNDVVTPKLRSKFNPSELLDSKTRKPEVYTKAMQELKRLEQEPICHRTAAQLLMDNCRGIEELDTSGHLDSAHLQRHHVESFSNGLTLCDMERAKFVIPEACAPFGSSSLYRASQDKHNRLEVTNQQVGDCLQALGHDSRHWTTWLSNRDKAVLFCRAARLDIDKDQAILLQKQLIELMQQFTSGLDDDLAQLKQNLATGSRAAESFVDTLVNEVENGKARLHTVFEGVSDDAKGVESLIKSILNSGNDVMGMLKLFMQTVIQGGAEMAAEQEQAFAVATTSFQQNMGDISTVIRETEAKAMAAHDLMEQLVPMLRELQERQDVLDQKTEMTLSALINATELLQTHSQNLEQASFKASEVSENLDRAVSATRTLQENLSHEPVSFSSSMSDLTLRVLTPMGALILGNFGMSRSLGGNLMLAVGGFLTGESAVQARNFLSWWMSDLYTQDSYPRPGENDSFPSRTFTPDKIEEAEIHFDMA